MSFKIEITKSFETELKKLSKVEQKMVYKKVQILADNPFYPSLRTKKIQGIENLFECSVNMDIRIIWQYRDGTIILLLDIGHHDIL
jgi:mRNA interferase RelE/StbE